MLLCKLNRELVSNGNESFVHAGSCVQHTSHHVICKRAIFDVLYTCTCLRVPRIPENNNEDEQSSSAREECRQADAQIFKTEDKISKVFRYSNRSLLLHFSGDGSIGYRWLRLALLNNHKFNKDGINISSVKEFVAYLTPMYAIRGSFAP